MEVNIYFICVQDMGGAFQEKLVGRNTAVIGNQWKKLISGRQGALEPASFI